MPTDPPLLDLAPPPASAAEDGTAERTIEISASSVDVNAAGDAVFSGQVEVKLPEGTLTAESASSMADGDVDVLGRINFVGPDVTVFGENGHYDEASETMSFSSAGFDLPKRPARGSAEQIEVASDSRMSLMNALFTTCPPENLAWELSARDIALDVNGGVGTARGVKLDFKGVPILYAPYFTFPINDARKSGFLTPDISKRDRTGWDLVVPYYLNLAPNYDLTLEPRYMSERGTQVRSDFRYLMPNSRGDFGFEYLPDDDETNTTRRYANLQHESLFGGSDQLEVLAGFEEVSDDAYFEDLGSTLSVTSQTHLNRFLDLTFFAPNWSLLTRLQNYQTIDPVLTDAERPYERVPQMVFGGRWLGRLLMFDSNTELVNFDRNVGTTGWRLDSTQEVSLRFARAGMFLTPAVGFRQTNYWIDNPAPGEDDTLTRGLPIGSLDMGLKFERNTQGARRPWVQTLEPRLLYVHVPFEDQSNLPVFDTIVPDFNLIQLFRKYQFVGPDRIANTDQLSFGVTTRLVDAANGRERLTATLGQTRYQNPQLVTLPGTLPTDSNASDYVAEARYRYPRRLGARRWVPMERRYVIDSTHGDPPGVPPEGRPPVRLRLSLPARHARARRRVARVARLGTLARHRPLQLFVPRRGAPRGLLRLGIRGVLLAPAHGQPQLREPAHRRDRQLDLAAARAEGPIATRHGAGRPPGPWYSGLPQYRPSLLRRAIL